VRHAHASLTPGGLATLQRRLGNRGMGALIQRLTLPTAEPEAGENTATAAQEQAELHAAAQHRADARRLLPTELEEVSAIVALAPPQGPGIVLGPGTKKLLDAIGRLGSRVAGPPSGYVRDPATEHGPPSFVLGKLEDPDGRITVTGDGLLEVTKTKRTPVKGKKGQFKVSMTPRPSTSRARSSRCPRRARRPTASSPRRRRRSRPRSGRRCSARCAARRRRCAAATRTPSR